MTVPLIEGGLALRPNVIHGDGSLLIRTPGQRIDIVDLSGRIVHTVSVGRPGIEKCWDLRDHEGRKILPGTYVCRARVYDNTHVVPFVVLR